MAQVSQIFAVIGIFIPLILCLLGIYTLILLIKALNIYINKNERY